jgi:hypothetical protein
MQEARLALVPMSTTALAAGARPDARQPLALYALGVACLASIALFAASMPVVSIGIMTLAAISSFLVGSTAVDPDRPATRPVDPESIASLDLRDTYRTTLFALEELDRTVADAPRMRSSVAPALERCRAAVTSCGHMAQLANPLQRYLESHDPAHIRWELDRLRARSEAARDISVAAALTRATSARRTQLATYDQIAAQRDRIHARLELVRAALESFTAMIVKLHGTDQEQRALSDESVIAHLDEISDDLAVLESVLEADPAA